MLAALFPYLVALPSPLSLQIEVPETVRSGDRFGVKVWLVNRSKAPVTVVDPTPLTYFLGSRFDGDLWRSGERVAVEMTGRWTGQWVTSNRFDGSAFRTITPGARLLLEDGRFGSEYVSGKRPGLGEMATAKLKALPAGRYTYRAEWSMLPPKAGQAARLKELGFAPTLTDEAKSLDTRSSKGRLRAERVVTIRPLDP